MGTYPRLYSRSFHEDRTFQMSVLYFSSILHTFISTEHVHGTMLAMCLQALAGSQCSSWPSPAGPPTLLAVLIPTWPPGQVPVNAPSRSGASFGICFLCGKQLLEAETQEFQEDTVICALSFFPWEDISDAMGAGDGCPGSWRCQQGPIGWSPARLPDRSALQSHLPPL